MTLFAVPRDVRHGHGHAYDDIIGPWRDRMASPVTPAASWHRLLTFSSIDIVLSCTVTPQLAVHIHSIWVPSQQPLVAAVAIGSVASAGMI